MWALVYDMRLDQPNVRFCYVVLFLQHVCCALRPEIVICTQDVN
jgi:hypothetical protein